MQKFESEKSASDKEVFNQSPQKQFLLVGIGASAGGVQALKDFFEHVPADSGVAYVVILHLSPEYDSQLTNVLQSVCATKVTKVMEKVQVVPNHVYVIPPNASLKMAGRSISVEKIHTIEERRAPIDIFFRTLADTNGSNAVAVVLSGTGADGSMGLKRVKENGGVVFVQNPREAEYSDMPRNAIATELVDEILNVADIPNKIIAYKDHFGKVAIPVTQELLEEKQQAALREIFTQLRIRTGHDFTNYKRATVLRRIERRINVRGLYSLPEYATYVRENPEEAQALLKDLLISVTNFFRDKDAFNYLERYIIPNIVQNKTAENAVRVWVAGCATGEEAYTLAMLFHERMYNGNVAPTLQIFATDIDEAAIATAREGFYTLNDAADVSPERLRRFFNAENGGYRVKKELRETILFANHNVLKDAPFSKMDLISCRNLLIYFNAAAQNRVMETFHFALNPGGYLLLGSSESTDGSNDLFLTLSKEYNVFQSRHVTTRPIPVPDSSLPTVFRVKLPETDNRLSKPTAEQENRTLDRISLADLHLRLLEQYAPPSLVINESHDIVHISESAGNFLQVTGGEPSNNLFKLIKQELRVELRTALYQAEQKRINVEVKSVAVTVGNETVIINLHVRPVFRQDDTARGFILIVFEPSKEVKNKEDVIEIIPGNVEPITRQLEEEVTNLRAQLRLSNEQFEVQTEELKASNEELQAMNEELRSATEELETSKEELQSINEELITVNQELKIKIEEVSQSNNDFLNLINSIDIGTVFLDRSLRVKLFTPATRELFNFISADIGRPMSDITSRLDYEDLLADAETVLHKLQTIEREVRATDGRIYLMQIQPYRTAEDRIKGVVMVFINITQRKQAEEAAHQLLGRNTEILESISDAFYAVDAQFNFTYINKKAEELWKRQRDTLIGKNYWTEFPAAVDTESYRMHYKVLEEGKAIQFETISPLINRWVDVSIYPNGFGGLSCYFRDITKRKETEEALRSSEARFRAFVTASNDVVYRMSPDWKEMYDLNGSNFIPNTTAPSTSWLLRYIPESDQPRVQATITEAIQTKSIFELEHQVFRVDGSIGWALSRAAPIMNKEGVIIEWLGAARDVTARKEAENRIRESEELLRVTMESAIDYVIISIDAEGIIKGWNTGAERIFGYTAEEAIGQKEEIIFTPEDRAAGVPQAEMKAALEEGRSIDERWHQRKDGSRLFMSGVLAPIRGSKMNGFVKVSRDLTEAQDAQEALRNSEERFRTVANVVPQIIWSNDAKGKANYFNQRWYEYSGLSNEASLGLGWEAIVHPDDAPASVEHWQQALAAGEVFDIEYRLRRADGRYCWHIGRNVPLRNPEGKIIGWFGSATDIEELKTTEELLRESRERLRVTVESAVDYAIITFNVDGIIEGWSTGAELIFGYSEAEAQGQFSGLIFIPEDREKGAPEQEMQTAREQGRAADERWHLRKDGARFYMSGVMTPIYINNVLTGYVKVARDMTERKNSEEALRESEERYRAIVNQTSVGIFRADINGNILFINNKATSMFGFAAPEYANKTIWDFISPEDMEEVKRLYNRLTEQGLPFQFEKKLRRLNGNGSLFWASVSMAPIKDAEGKTHSAVCVVTDITGRKEAEEALRETMERFQYAVRATKDVIWEIDFIKDRVWWSSMMQTLFGYTQQQVQHSLAWYQSLIHPDDRERVVNNFKKAVEGNDELWIDEFRYKQANGTYVCVTNRSFIIRNQEGKAIRTIGAMQDISEQKKAAAAIKEGEQRLRITLEAGELGAWDWNLVTNEIVWNEQHFRLFGIEPKQEPVTPEYFIQFVYPEDLPELNSKLEESLNKTGVFEDEYRIIRKNDKQVRWMSGYGRVIEWHDGKPIRLAGVMYDCTERRQAADILQAAQNSLNTALDAAQMGVWDLDLQTGVITRSTRHDQLLGYDTWQEDWSTEKAKRYVVEEDKHKFDEAYQHIIPTGLFNLEARVKHKDGVITWIHYYGRVFKNESGEPTHAAGVIFDITDRKTVEQKKDEFIGIASHELKTPVTSIKAYTEILQDQFEEAGDKQSAQYLGKLNGQVDRLTHLIRDLLDATRISEGRLMFNTTTVDINHLLRETAEDLQRTTGKQKIELDTDALPTLRGDRERLQQVFVNLLSNAIKYSPEADKVLIKTCLDNDGNINIEVQDFGIGMTTDTQSRLFERFFRSADPHVATFPGLGLGLYISMQIVKQHKGTIKVKSEKDKGSVFTVILPVEH